jgi:hypothetical protein
VAPEGRRGSEKTEEHEAESEREREAGKRAPSAHGPIDEDGRINLYGSR